MFADESQSMRGQRPTQNAKHALAGSLEYSVKLRAVRQTLHTKGVCAAASILQLQQVTCVLGLVGAAAMPHLMVALHRQPVAAFRGSG